MEMYIPIGVLIMILWVLVGVFCAYKQERALPIGSRSERIIGGAILVVFAPLWLFGAVIRQLIIEDWK